jgi:general secretion pathway protein F
VVSALAIAKTVLPELLSERADRARQLLSEGVSISSAMRDASLTTPIADQMLAVAERTGDMGPMMDQIAGFFDEELGRWLDVSMRLLEPVLMAVIGVAIGTVVVFMYMPIFELASSVR